MNLSIFKPGLYIYMFMYVILWGNSNHESYLHLESMFLPVKGTISWQVCVFLLVWLPKQKNMLLPDFTARLNNVITQRWFLFFTPILAVRVALSQVFAKLFSTTYDVSTLAGRQQNVVISH